MTSTIFERYAHTRVPRRRWLAVPIAVCVAVAALPSIGANATTSLVGDTNSDGTLNVLDVLGTKRGVLYGGTSTQDYYAVKRVVLGLDEPTFEEVDENLGTYVLTSRLNFREYAGTEYASYGMVDQYTAVEVVETAYSSDGVLWGRYLYDGTYGWSSLKYASKLQSVGTTDRGFEVLQGEGMTFVGGVLVVNKTYSLPSSYVPNGGSLTQQTQDAFSAMQTAAAREGLNLYVSSGYRSYQYQVSLYQRYVDRDGKSAADTYSARAGHSEHQTGLCFDLNSIDDSFANTKEGAWVAKNCHRYGFIVRFPEGKDAYTGYQYEPWHLRYVGVELATAVYESGLSLEEYFGISSQYE